MPDPIPVLYVDDEPALLEICKQYLEQNAAFQVDTEVSALTALVRLRTSRYGAIIADYQMPDMDGIEFLKEVRGSGITTPFILFTGRGREEVVIQAFENGADFYLQKGGESGPQFAELMYKIQLAVRRRRSEEAMRLKIDELSADLAVSKKRLCQLIASEERFFLFI